MIDIVIAAFAAVVLVELARECRRAWLTRDGRSYLELEGVRQ